MLFRKQPLQVQTFADFSKILYNQIVNISYLFNTCNVFMGQYFEGSLKEGTRVDHGSGMGLIITFDDYPEIPPNFISKFISNIKDKMNLNKYLANKFLTYHLGKQSILRVTIGDSIISNTKVLSETGIHQCSSEEANPRLVHNVINLVKKGLPI